MIAGNRIIANSNIEIYGFVTAESNRTPGTHVLTSNVTIYRELVTTYVPANEIPDVTVGSRKAIEVLWSRYL